MKETSLKRLHTIWFQPNDIFEKAKHILATWCEELTHWKRAWCWERLKVGEGDNRQWDGWMVSLTQWTWVWASSGRWWRTEKPRVLQFMGSQRVGHDWDTEQQGQSGRRIPAAIRIATSPYGKPQGSSGCEKHRKLAAEMPMKGMISVSPASCSFPYTLNSLIWDIWFSLTNNHLLMFRLPALCCRTSVYPGSHPPPRSSSLRVTWDAISWF